MEFLEFMTTELWTYAMAISTLAMIIILVSTNPRMQWKWMNTKEKVLRATAGFVFGLAVFVLLFSVFCLREIEITTEKNLLKLENKKQVRTLQPGNVLIKTYVYKGNQITYSIDDSTIFILK